MERRRFLAIATLAPACAYAARTESLPPVVRGRALEFARDFGSHPEFRIEWWYVTGQVDANGNRLGFQATFFRARHETTTRGRFAPRQILFAHTAVSDPRVGTLLHAQAAARAGFVDAYASETDTDVRIGRWQISRERGVYRVEIGAANAAQPFTLALTLSPTQPLLLQGDRGFSRKGPSLEQASYYYSEPHLAVDGSVTLQGTTHSVRGRAWLDHEWSQSYLDPRAAGWDWTGINLDDGGAIMAFRIRDRDDASRTLWAGATFRDAKGRTRAFEPGAIAFAPRRFWTSARTKARYPVACAVRLDDALYEIEPLFDDQELDSRMRTGFVYWEGAVTVRRDGVIVGRGYLELTGYAGALRLER